MMLDQKIQTSSHRGDAEATEKYPKKQLTAKSQRAQRAQRKSKL
jgi:hypothetical protein